MSTTMEDCLKNCRDCEKICQETFEYARAKSEGISPEQIALLEDCVQICRTSADFMERDSKNHAYTCGACAQICQQCADMCAEMTDDAQMQQCAQVCRDCAESCREMSATTH